jgi:predicted small integral membrane protein
MNRAMNNLHTDHDSPPLRHEPEHGAALRLMKAAMVLCVGLWALLIAADNVIDYDSNWQFVRHVLSMDTVFATNPLRWRAVTDPRFQALGYWMIIATQCTMSLLCLAGAWRLLRASRSRSRFIAAKPLAACGLGTVFLLYYFGFVVVGGEWFSMWQSQIWNGQAKAAVFLTCAMLVLIVLLCREEEIAAVPSQDQLAS